MGYKEGLQQLIERDLSRVVDDIAGFRMTRSAGTNLLISGVGDIPSAIPRKYFLYSFQLLELRLRTPKTTGRKSCRIQLRLRNSTHRVRPGSGSNNRQKKGKGKHPRKEAQR